MKIKISGSTAGVEAALDIMIGDIRNLKPILSRFAKYKRGEIKERFKGQHFAPLAPSTVEHREHEHVGKFTKFGNLRAAFVKRRQAQYTGKLLRTLKQGDAKGLTAFTARFKKQSERLEKQLAKQQAKPASERKIGGTVAERDAKKNRPILGKLSSSIEATLQRDTLEMRSRVPWAGVHNDGGTAGHGAHIPKRTFLELTSEDLRRLKEIADEYLQEIAMSGDERASLRASMKGSKK